MYSGMGLGAQASGQKVSGRDASEVELLRDRLLIINASISQATRELEEAADILYGQRPTSDESRGEVSNAKPSLSEAISWLENRMVELLSQIKRF